MTAKIIGARFAQLCRQCREPIAVGQSVELIAGMRGGRCMRCVDPARHTGVETPAVKVRPIRTYEQLFPSD